MIAAAATTFVLTAVSITSTGINAGAIIDERSSYVTESPLSLLSRWPFGLDDIDGFRKGFLPGGSEIRVAEDDREQPPSTVLVAAPPRRVGARRERSSRRRRRRVWERLARP